MGCRCQVETAKNTILRHFKSHQGEVLVGGYGQTLGGLSEIVFQDLNLGDSYAEEAKSVTWHALEELIKNGTVFKREEKAHFVGTIDVYYLNNQSPT